MASVLMVLLSVFLLFDHAVHGSRAQADVLKKTGEDLHLQLKKPDDVPKEFFIVQWRVNGSVVLVSFVSAGEPRVTDLYRGRVDVFVGNFSVKLKNLQKSDSGVYAARVTVDQEQQLAEYQVTVEDPVSPVKLTVDPVTNSKDSCDLTVTCRSLDSHQISISTTVTCNTTTCSQQGGERSKVTTSGATLQFDLLNDTIICDHSNQVSSTNDTMRIRDFCPEKSVVLNAAAIIGSSAAPLVLGLILCIVIKCRRKAIENTVYAVPQDLPAIQPQSRSVTEDCTPTSTYALVQFHTGPDESTRTIVTNLPETVYAEVNKARKIKPKSPTPRASTGS